MTYASSLILEVSEDLQDQASGDTYARWSQADLLKYLNAGERQIVYFKPTAYVVSKVYQLSEGVSQSLPDGSSSFQDPSSNTLAQAIELVRILRNKGNDGLISGPTIYPVRPQDMDELYPGINTYGPELVGNQNPDDDDTWWRQVRCSFDSSGGIISSTDNNTHYIDGSFRPAQLGEVYRIEAKVKPGDKDWVRIALSQTDVNDQWIGAGSIYFDVQNGVLGTITSGYSATPIGAILSTDSDGYAHCIAEFTIDYPTAKSSYSFIAAADADNSYLFAGDGSTVDLYIKNISHTNRTILNYIFDPEKRTSFGVYPEVMASSEIWIEAQYSAVPPEIETAEDPATGDPVYSVSINLGDEYREPLKTYMKYRAHAKDASSSMYAKQESVAYWNLFLTQIGRKDLIEKQYRGNYGNRD